MRVSSGSRIQPRNTPKSSLLERRGMVGMLEENQENFQLKVERLPYEMLQIVGWNEH